MIVKLYDANKIPDLSDEGILDYLSYQPKSDYRTPVKIERLTGQYAVRVSFSERVSSERGASTQASNRGGKTKQL